MAERIKLTRRTSISKKDIQFKYSRSGGPGGQHVNTTNTQVTVLFDVNNCDSLSGGQKKRILNKLKNRANKEGVIMVSSQRHRSQRANRKTAIDKLVAMLRNALKRKRRRKKSRIPQKAHRKRLKEKKRRSELKKQRANIKPGDY